VALVRNGYAHDAVLTLERDGDDRAPGGAITLALCGSWSHRPPCPLAPHYTGVHRSGVELTLRLLFAADPADEQRVRNLVEETLAHGEGDTPDGSRTRWEVLRSGPSTVRPQERERIARLIRS
jgi:hypothetical protein